MRRPSLAVLACLVMLAFMGVLASDGAADAQSLMRLFGAAQPRGRQIRTRHRAVRHQAMPGQMSPSAPLPVPRPHFAGDKPPHAATIVPPPDTKPPDTKTPDTKTPEPPSAPPQPSAVTPKVAETPPPAPPPAAPPAVPQRAVAPSGATNAFTPRQISEDAACFDRLKARKAAFEPIAIGPQPDKRCTVVQPVRLTSLALSDGVTIAFPDHPTIACATADVFTSYIHDLLAPLAKGGFGTGLTAVWTGPGLECRSRDHIFGAKLSAHGQGLAIDIAQLKLADGRMVEVGTPKSDADTAFETAARAGACGYFHTVLGPGSDSYHRSHWHFDLEVRGKTGDSKYCK